MFVQPGCCGWPLLVSPAVTVLRLVPSQSHGDFTRRLLDRSANFRPTLVALELGRLAGDVDCRDRRICRVEDRRRDGADAGFVVAVAPGQTFFPIRVELGTKL